MKNKNNKNLGAEWRRVGNKKKREDESDERRERPGQLASVKSLWVKVSQYMLTD